ncbi:hypothetical protein HKX48_004259 [Thoreauomyces humboldtii]|nr:hypothetical protein HKX48_004259 [Thoreauomyces humboldtii]
MEPHRVGQFICVVIHRTWTTGLSLPSQSQPHPSFTAFVSRVVRVSGVPNPILFLALLFIVRLGSGPHLDLATAARPRPREESVISCSATGALSLARLFSAALILAQKTQDDNRFTNKTWAELTGFALADLNAMEADFLARIAFRLHVSEPEYNAWVQHCSGWARQIGSPLKDFTAPQRVTPPPIASPVLPEYYRKRKIGIPDPGFTDDESRRTKIPRRPTSPPRYPQSPHHQLKFHYPIVPAAYPPALWHPSHKHVFAVPYTPASLHHDEMSSRCPPPPYMASLSNGTVYYTPVHPSALDCGWKQPLSQGYHTYPRI